MIRCTSGSIQVVTKVARLRCGLPLSVRSSAIRRIASGAGMPSSGSSMLGTSSTRNLFP